MNTKLYVGNLPFTSTSQDLERVFAPHGTLVSASVITDRDTGRSRGFGFVEVETPEQAQAAIEALNGFDLDGRQLVVNEAREREPRRTTQHSSYRSESGNARDRGFRGGRR